MSMHTHFGSATHFAGTMLEIALGVTLWRIGWAHALMVNNRHVQGLARAALFQL